MTKGIITDYQPDYPEFTDLFLTNDLNLLYSLLVVYPYVVEPQTLFDLIIDKFGGLPEGDLSVIQTRYTFVTRIVNVLLIWIERYPSDFTDKMQFGLEFFAKMISHKPNFKYVAEHLLEALERPTQPHFYDWGYLRPTGHQPEILPGKKRMNTTTVKKYNWLAELESNVIAEQLTALEWDLFVNIEPRDFMQHAFGKLKGENSLSKAVKHFNFISALVKTLILIQETPDFRAQVFIKFVKVCRHLRKSNNYHTLFAGVNGLDHSSIRRLKQTHKAIKGGNSKEYESFETLKKLISPSDDYEEYRTALENTCLPCIPYIGLFAKDMNQHAHSVKYAAENAEDHAPDISKFLNMGNYLSTFSSYKIKYFHLSRDYGISPDHDLINLIKSSLVMNEETAAQRSLQLEP